MARPAYRSVNDEAEGLRSRRPLGCAGIKSVLTMPRRGSESTDTEGMGMPPLFWLAACVYPVVGAVCVFEANCAVPRADLLLAPKICTIALAYAAAWPLRALARPFRRD